MIDYSLMIKNETPDDVLLYLSGRKSDGVSHPQLDRYFTMNKRLSNIDVIDLVTKMINNGYVSCDEKQRYIKGPKWKAPKFVIEKKYGISQ